MNKMEVESETMRRDRAETLELSFDDVLPSKQSPSIQRSPGSSWKDSRTLYEPKTPRVRDLAHSSSGHDRSPWSSPLSPGGRSSSTKKRDSNALGNPDFLLPELSPNKPPLRSSFATSSPSSRQSSSSRQFADVSLSHQVDRLLNEKPPRFHSSSHSLSELPPRLPRKKHGSHSRRGLSSHSSSHSLTDLPATDEKKQHIHRRHNDHHGHSSHSSSHSLTDLSSTSRKMLKSHRHHHDRDHSSLSQDAEARRSHKKKSKKKKRKKHSSSPSSRTTSTCSSSLSWGESHADGSQVPNQRLVAIADHAVHERPREKQVSFSPMRHVRTFTTGTEGDESTVDTDETPRTRPGRGSSSDSDGNDSFHYWRSRRTQGYDSTDSSTLSSLEYTSSLAKHPPTDLEFALGMDSAARKLKRIAKDQRESVVQKQIDYDQLRNLLDVYAKDPMNANQDQLNHLLMVMGDVITDRDDGSCSTTKPSSLSSANSPSSSKHYRVAHQRSPGADFSQKFSPRESMARRTSMGDRSQGSKPRHTKYMHDEIYPTQDLDLGSALSNGEEVARENEIVESVGDYELDFVADMCSFSSSSSLPVKRNTNPPPTSSQPSPSSRDDRNKHKQSASPSVQSGRNARSSSVSSGASTTSALSSREMEIYKAIDLQEGSSILSDAKEGSKIGMDRYKKDVLEVFGGNLHGTEDFVAVPLQPAVSRGAINEVDEDGSVSNDSERRTRTSEGNETTSNEESEDTHRCLCPRPPRRLIPKMLKRMKGRRNLRRDE